MGGSRRPSGGGEASPAEAPRGLGPRALGQILPRITRPAFRRRSPAAAQIMADWAELVGPALAAAAVPERLSAGTLTLACSGPVAMELQHLAPQIVERINAALGRVAVERLRFRQRPPPSPPTPAPPAARPATLPPAAAAALAPRLAAIADPGLRAALERLAGRVYRGRGGA
jgi:hypothetical protein